MLLLNQRTLFLLNRIFVVILLYEYYVLLKRKENACDEILFLNFS